MVDKKSTNYGAMMEMAYITDFFGCVTIFVMCMLIKIFYKGEKK